MNDDRLTTLLEQTLREQALRAPDTAAVRSRLETVRPLPHRSRWVPVLAAAAVLAVVGTLLALRPLWGSDPADQATAPPSGTEGETAAGEPVKVGVYLAVADDTTARDADWVLERREVEATSTGDVVHDAIEALLDTSAKEGGWFEASGVQLRSVSVGREEITVDVDRSLGQLFEEFFCVCPDAEVLLQQIAWTAQESSRTDLPVRLTVRGQPAVRVAGERIEQPTYAELGYAGPAMLDGPWFEKSCAGGLSIRMLMTLPTGNDAGRRTVVLANLVPDDGPPRQVTLHQQAGERLGFLVEGDCGAPVTSSVDGGGVMLKTGGTSYVAGETGRALISFHRPRCEADQGGKGQDPCTGEPELVAEVLVTVVR